MRFSSDRFDPVLTDFARSTITDGAIVWDVGANVGLFAFTAAGLAGPGGLVVAVEPDIWLANNLRRASRWNPSSAELVVVPAAIADTVGVREFAIAENNRAVSYLTVAGGSAVTGGIRERQLVPTLTLDTLAETLPTPDVLKIDVEGAEAMVLEGGRRVLEAKPIILVETSQVTSSAVHQMLSAHGYRYMDASNQKPCAMPVFNTIAIPR